ncbi:MAG: hypothetical protein H6703_03465 [Myxococcales bacterium]|nr:hypothetical protein [Myxococcales bacterium]
MTTPPKTPADPSPAARPELDEIPPLLGSWRNIYLVVLGNLAVLVVIFWLVTRVYR